jgi:PASTA domain
MMRIAGTMVMLVSLLALSACASAASAEPLSMTFTEDRANVGADQLEDAAMFEAPDTAPFQAQIDPGSGSITAGVMGVPVFETFIEDDPVDANVAVEFQIGIITGSFNQATGELTLSGKAGGTLTANGKHCIVSTTPSVLTLSTSTAASTEGSPRSGTPFTHGLTGAGSIAGAWTDMQATPVDPEPGGDTAVCEVVDEHIEGPGGIWMQQTGDVVAPSAPQLLSTDPASPDSSGTPRIRGAAETGSTVRIYAGPDCTGLPVATGTAADLGSPGIAVAVAEGATAAFSATAADPAGNTSPCSAAISYTRTKVSPPPPPPVQCIVPKLAGKTLARAKSALRAANCAVGKVTKPKARKGKKPGPLVVKSSKPSAGTTLEAGSKVNLRLGPRPRKAHATRDPRLKA